jgi:hypothetical protein
MVHENKTDANGAGFSGKYQEKLDEYSSEIAEVAITKIYDVADQKEIAKKPEWDDDEMNHAHPTKK